MNPQKEWEWYLEREKGASIEDRRAFLAGYEQGYDDGHYDGLSDALGDD